MSVLVDTSVWIEYFRSGNQCEKLDFYIDENLVVINDLILAELVPALKARNHHKIVEFLHAITKIDLIIHWGQLIEFQVQCHTHGFSEIGISDLIIAQNARQNHCELYTLDHHFRLIKDIIGLKLVQE